MTMRLLGKNHQRAMRGLLDELSAANNGVLNQHDLETELSSYLIRAFPVGGDDALSGIIARSLAQSFVRERRWQPSADQPTMFDGEAYISIGENEYVKMADAKVEHLRSHRLILAQNYEAQTVAYERKRDYLDNRIDRLDGTDRTLGDIEP